MAKYRQLNEHDRHTLKHLKIQGFSLRKIADILGFNVSTISRELSRNSINGSYHEKYSHLEAVKRKAKNSRKELSKEVYDLLLEGLNKKWSPEQIHGVASNSGVKMPCLESLYQYIYRDSKSGGILYTHLRRSRKRRKFRKLRLSLKEVIKDRKSIEDRPQEIEDKLRCGDWEGDLIVGTAQTGYLITLVDRKSKYTLIAHSKDKRSKSICRYIVKAMKPLPDDLRLSITFDNGSEFSQHKNMNSRTGCDIYFAHPYSSWERGLNENTNGLIRQYFPKKYDFSTITEEEVLFVQNALNSRPRKTLGYKTPNELFLAS